jgi:hypothetical protein
MEIVRRKKRRLVGKHAKKRKKYAVFIKNPYFPIEKIQKVM